MLGSARLLSLAKAYRCAVFWCYLNFELDNKHFVLFSCFLQVNLFGQPILKDATPLGFYQCFYHRFYMIEPHSMLVSDCLY